jgi:archaellum component FlaF (FlaF/FlaG flagellin family)
MAASTAGHFVLKDAQTGRTRIETFTMTPANLQYITFASNGQTFILVSPNGEYIVDMLLNGDGVTTCSQGKFLVDGQDIRVRVLLANFVSTSQVTRMASPIGIHGNAQLQFQVFT